MLAIMGGVPTRAERIRPSFHADEGTRTRVLAMLDGGTLSDWYGGPHGRELEERFAAYHGVEEAVAVNSGTAALHAALAAAGIGPGDEVILPSACFFTAATAVLQQNAIPVLSDCEENSLGIAHDQIPDLLTPRTRAVIVVHMYGYPARVEDVREMARRHDLVVIEDCGHSLGASVDGRKVGTFGDFGCFSLASPRKHVSVGEGGMVITDDPGRAREVRRIANKGKDDGWFSQRTMGYSYVMPEFAAVVGLQGLAGLDEEIDRRRAAAEAYDVVLDGTGLEGEDVPPGRRHVFFRKLIRVPAELAHLRDWMVAAIEAENVSAKPPHAPLHRIDWIADRRGYPRGCPYTCGHGRTVDYRAESFPTTDRELDRLIDLETGPGLPVRDATVSAKAVRKVFDYVLEHPRRASVAAEEFGRYDVGWASERRRRQGAPVEAREPSCP